MRELYTQAGLNAIAQRVFRGPAPFLLTEAVATEPVSVIPSPHFQTRPAYEQQLRDATA
jgi:hypothetical protein